MKNLPPILGLVLVGGKSQRMGRDKASLTYSGGIQQWRATAGLLKPICQKVYISIREGQTLEDWTTGDTELIPDDADSNGPLAGLLTAMRAHPEHAVLAVACDLPLLGRDVLDILLANRGDAEAVAFRSANDGLPEPLCAIYEPYFYEILVRHVGEGRQCPRKILILEDSQVRMLDLPRADALDNANTPEDYERLSAISNANQA